MQSDLALASRNTEKFISYRPVSAVVKRPALTDDGAGGIRKGAHTALPPQRIRRVPTALNIQVDTSEMGRVERFDLYLVGMPDFDVQKGDVVEVGDNTYDVRFVSRIPEHRIAAGVVEVRDGS